MNCSRIGQRYDEPSYNEIEKTNWVDCEHFPFWRAALIQKLD